MQESVGRVKLIAMTLIATQLAAKLERLPVAVAVVLPDGKQVGAREPALVLRCHSYEPLTHLARGEIGRVGSDYVEGKLTIEGSMRELMRATVGVLERDPRDAARSGWIGRSLRGLKSVLRHRPTQDARQIEHHYDVSDAFYALWLDPRRVYSCAYFERPEMSLAEAQEAKLDLICRKLRLTPGQGLLDVGAGWGGLIFWAAEHYRVIAHGITLSRHQYDYVQQQIEVRGLRGQVSIALLDYRALPADQVYDRIASIGMFEHVGLAMLPRYFQVLKERLRPGGLIMNHGITSGGTRHAELGAGLGRFIERYIFPGGELHHISHVLAVMHEAGLEPLDIENLRPHYARTLWAWSDALEARLDEARRHVSEAVLRAYRLYLAGCAMAFEQGWIAIHQVLASHPDGHSETGVLPGSQCEYPFNRGYMYRAD